MDVMKIAKDALLSTEAETRLGSDLVENFAWLKYVLPESTIQTILERIVDYPVATTHSKSYRKTSPDLGSTTL